MKKIIATMLVLMMAATSFAACNSNSGDSSKADTSVSATDKEDEESEKDDAGDSKEADSKDDGAADDLSGSIEFWGWNDDEENTKAVIEAYEAEFPDRSISLTIVPVREYPDKLTAAMAAKTEIDAMCINGNADFAQLASRNQLMNLDDKIEESGFDLSIYGDNFSQVMYDDSVYSLPYRSSVWVVAYNKDLFEENGVDFPTDDMTWEEIQALAEKMTYGEGTEKVYGLHYHNRNDDYLQVAYQNGFDLLSDDFTYVKKGMELKVEAMEKGITMPHTEIVSTGIGVRQPFEQKTNAMYFTADWTINQMRQSLAEGVIDFHFDFIAMPHLEGKPAEQTHGSWIHTGVSANSDKQDLAYEFVQYLGGIPGAKIFAEGGTLPAAKYDEEVKAAFIGDRSQDPENIDVLFTQTVSDPSPLTPNLKAIDNIFKEESELAFIGEKTIDEAIESIKERREEFM